MVDQTDFFAALQQCSTGERASLRRNCGKLLKDADGQAVVIFYRYVPRSIPAWQEDYWFAAACFSCLWDGDAHFIPLEQALAQLKLTSDSMEHRLAGLLDQRWEADGFFLGKLSRIIKLAKAKGIAIDCALLLEDLLYWNSSTQSVQRKWAKAMYE